MKNESKFVIALAFLLVCCLVAVALYKPAEETVYTPQRTVTSNTTNDPPNYTYIPIDEIPSDSNTTVYDNTPDTESSDSTPVVNDTPVRDPRITNASRNLYMPYVKILSADLHRLDRDTYTLTIHFDTDLNMNNVEIKYLVDKRTVGQAALGNNPTGTQRDYYPTNDSSQVKVTVYIKDGLDPAWTFHVYVYAYDKTTLEPVSDGYKLTCRTYGSSTSVTVSHPGMDAIRELEAAYT